MLIWKAAATNSMIIIIFYYRQQQDGGDYEYEDVSSLLREYEEEFIPHRQVQTSSSAPGPSQSWN